MTRGYVWVCGGMGGEASQGLDAGEAEPQRWARARDTPGALWGRDVVRVGGKERGGACCGILRHVHATCTTCTCNMYMCMYMCMLSVRSRWQGRGRCAALARFFNENREES